MTALAWVAGVAVYLALGIAFATAMRRFAPWWFDLSDGRYTDETLETASYGLVVIFWPILLVVSVFMALFLALGALTRGAAGGKR